MLGRLRTFAFLVIVATPVLAADYSASISAGVAHTDNIDLAPTDEEAQSETVYQVSPSFGISQQSRRVRSNVAYRLQAYNYRDLDETEIFHLLDGQMELGLDPENFFLDFGASRTQSIVDPELDIPASNLPVSRNRVERDDYYFGPRYQYAIGNAVTASGSARRNWVRYDDRPETATPGGFGAIDSTNDAASVGFDNYRRGNGATWAVRYATNRTEYDGFEPYEFRRASLELGLWTGDSGRLFVSGGKESAWDQPFDPSLEDSFWEVGFTQALGTRLSAEIGFGERTFGTSRRASIDYRFGRGNMTVNYTESPTTQSNTRYRRGGLLDPDQPDDYLARPGSPERFISNRLQWAIDFELRRTDLTLSLFDETREQRFSVDGTPLDDESQSGASLGIEWQVGRRTDVFVRGTRVKTDFTLGTGGRRQMTNVTTGARFGLGARTDLVAEYERTSQDPAGDEPITRPYTASLVLVTITRQLGSLD